MNMNATENPQYDATLRIALYSHDTCGLGHMRRNLLIAEALVERMGHVNILLITGAREAAAFRFPAGVDAVTLPSLYKEANEAYRPRSFDFEMAEFIRLRSRIIKTSIEAFEPDLFIVDKVPRGTRGELDETLSYLKEHPRTRCVLGLRDILDRPEVVGAEWRTASNFETIERYYDAVWIYGDRAVYDAPALYDFPEAVTRKTAFTGYLDPSTRLQCTHPCDRTRALLNELGERFFMCAVGGGQDGALVAERFADARFPDGVKGLILTGPHMPAEAAERLEAMVADRPHLKCVNFLAEPIHLYRAAERVVAMGGYNTTLELLSLGARALIIPRVRPREEQWIRSLTLHALGLLDLLHPDELTGEAISEWFTTPAAHASAQSIDMNGLERIPELVRSLISGEATIANNPSTNPKYHVVA